MLGSDITNLSEVIFKSADIGFNERLGYAAQHSVGLEDQTVVTLHAEGDEFDLWISILHAIGIDVQIGVSGIHSQDNILFLVQATVWRNDRAKIAYIRRKFPNAILCILTGICRVNYGCAQVSYPIFKDTRSVLQAAGIGFFSVQSEQHVTV